MNYIGKFISNFKEFYNEINSATLTGAIDVIVVKQPDGTYACSPFHVRFGKMGVLRSKEKIVDIEVNGEPVDIHMKLGDTGEAFFVEEVENEDDQLSVPSHLATSPLPSQLHDCGIDYIADQLEKMKIESGQGSISGKTGDLLSPFSKSDARAFLAGGDNSEVINTTISPIKREAASCDPRGARSSSDSSLDEESVFMPEHKETNYLNLEGQQISHSQQAPTKLLTSTSSTPTIALKSVALQTSGLIGNEKESIEELVATKTFQQAATTPTQSSTVPSSTKKRRRKKSTMKKFAANNKPLSSKDDFNVKSQLTTTTHENEEVFVMDDDDTEVSSFGIEEAKSINKPLPRSASVPSTSLSNIVKIPANTFKQQMLSSVLSDIHPYSDGEVDQSSTGSAKSKRPSSPLSDTEYENSRHDATCQTGGEHIEWSWGEFPRSNTPSSNTITITMSNTNSNSNNQNMSQHSREFIESAANSLKTASNDSNTRNRGLNASETNKLFGVLKFMKKEDTLKNSKEVSKEEGVFLDDLNGMDPEKAGLYLSSGKSVYSVKRSSLDDTESGNGSSLSQSPPLTSSGPTSQDSDSDHDARAGGGGDGDGGLANKSKSELKLLDRYFRTIAISACGGLEDDTISSERFEQSFISFDDFCANPVEKLQNPALVVRIDGKYYNWQAAAPLILSIILYRRSLPIHCIDALMDKTMPKKQQLKQQQQNQQESRGSWWSSWTRSTSSVTKFDDNTSSGTLNVSRIEMPDDLEASFTASNQDQQQQEQQTELSSPEQEENSIEITIESDRRDENFLASSELEDCQDIIIKKSVRGHRRKNSTFQYKKVLRISSRQIEGLNLQEGRNEVVFSVTTAYQGTTRCKCHIYLWNHDDKIIVSDIDGTITKSDILGHILPVIGKDWAQSGVANLFNKIQDNGYKLLYLSARAIGQARITRDYLRSVRQGDICLPDGPLLLSPTSLISALHREVIEKKPEEFKIKCLKDIQCLFPTNPFYAGFGNKINDTWAYRAINIPSSRIFTINHRGELRLGLILSWHSSYNRLSDLVDQMFPPLHKSQDPKSSDFLSEYSSFNYWRDPVPEISQVEPQESKNEPQNR